MNILMISPFDLVTKRLWGPTIRLHSLAKELNRSGHKVLLAGPPPFEGDKPTVLDGVGLYYFKRPFHRYSYPDDEGKFKRQKINRRRRLPLVILSRVAEIINIIKNNRIEVLYVNRSFIDTAYPAYMAHILMRVPIICDWDDIEGLHGFSTSFRHPLRLQFFETFNELTFPRLADATVVASNYLKEFAVNIGVKEEKLFYAPTVADSEIFNPFVSGSHIRDKYKLHGKKVLFYAGNLMEGNGVKVENIFYTLKSLTQMDSSFFLLVVGDGDLLMKKGKKGMLIELVENLGIGENVVFTGGVPYLEMPGYIAAADLCLALFPLNLITMSKSPIKIYEYMAAGKAVVARDVGEISRCIIDGENGFLVYSDNPFEYAKKILEIFSQGELLKRLGENARRTIETGFSWAHSADVVLKACEEITYRKKKV